MKVLFVSKYYSPHIGGVERHVCEVSKILIKRGIDVSVITKRHSGNLNEEETQNGVRIIRINYPKLKLFGLFVIWIKIVSLIKEFYTADIVHIHDVFVWIIPIRFLCPFKKMYITFHGYENYPLKLKYIFVRHISNILCKKNICVGSYIEKWYKIKADIITYGAVNQNIFNINIVNQPKYDAIYIGRINREMGIDTYIQAVKILGNMNKFKFIVIGELESHNINEENIIYLRPTNNVQNYLNESKIVFSSGYLSILEAFACKKLVFSVYKTSLKKDYLKMTPFSKWLIICSNSKDLVSKINYYLSNPEKAETIVNNAYEWVIGQTWEVIADSYITLWDLKIN